MVRQEREAGEGATSACRRRHLVSVTVTPPGCAGESKKRTLELGVKKRRDTHRPVLRLQPSPHKRRGEVDKGTEKKKHPGKGPSA